MPGGSRAYEMARRLVSSGHEVHMVTSYRLQDIKDTGWFKTEEAGIHVHWLPVPYTNHMGYTNRIKSFFRFAIRAAQKAASLDGDVIFATSTPLTIALPGAYAARRNRIPMVFEVRDLWPELPIAIGALKDPVSRWAARRLERFAYRHAARVVALSPGMAEGVVRTGYPEDRISIIPNSADLNLFSYDSERADRFRREHPELGTGPVVLYAGTLGRINGVVYMVHLAAHVREKHPEIRFVVIGSGQEEEHIQAVAREHGVYADNFFMYPRLPKKDVVDAFSAASIVTSWFIDLPEMEANSANKFFDGLASGTAIAINYGGWQAELLRETGAGVILSRDYEEAATQLVDLLNDSVRLERAGNAARKLAEDRFSRDELAAKLEQILLEVAVSQHDVFVKL